MPAHPATVLAVAIKTRYQRRINLTWETGTFAKNYSENRFFLPTKKSIPTCPQVISPSAVSLMLLKKRLHSYC